MRRNKLFVGAVLAAAAMLSMAAPAVAVTTTDRIGEPRLRDGFPSNPSANDGLWYRQGTTPGGGAILTKDFGAPPEPQELGDGALALTTNNQNSAEAELVTYQHVYGTPLSDVSNLSYWTYHSSETSGFTDANAHIDLQIDIDGDLSTTTDRTTLVYETYWNDVEGTDPQHPEGMLPNEWQFWDTIAGGWWSTNDIACGDFLVTATAGGPPNTRPGDIANNCENAKTVSLGVAVGSYNPNYIVAVDGVHFETVSDAHTWDFGPK